MSHLQAVLPLVRTINATAFPGITQESRQAVQQLLEDNKKHHIYFNDQKFHNHVVHHLLDAYALGCSANRLHEIYKQHLPIHRPAPPKTLQITESNWREYLEKRDHWTDYVDFFSLEVQQLGIDEAVNKYLFVPELFVRLFSVPGVNHGVIHLGFGIIFKEPLIVAEALALAALEPTFNFPPLSSPPSPSPSPSPSSSCSLLEIIEQVQHDNRFDEVIKPGDIDSRFHALNGTKHLLQEYLDKWQIKETEYDVAAKEKELFEAIVLLYAALVPPGKHAMIDFFLMHSLTGSVYVHELLKHFTSDKGAQILKALFGVTLFYYIATARPKLYISELKAYVPKLPASPNAWLEVIKVGIETNDVHGTKALYSLLQYEAWFGEFDGIFLKAAQLTADALTSQPNNGIFQPRVWSQAGLGFGKTWEE